MIVPLVRESVFGHPDSKQRPPFHLTAKEKSDLITFMHTLTDTTFVNNPDLHTLFWCRL